MTTSLPNWSAIEEQQISPYRRDRVRMETLESLQFRCGGGKAQRQMVETIFNYFADQYDLLNAVDTQVPDKNGDEIDILVQCPDPMFSSPPVLVGVEVDGPDHLQQDKYWRQTIRDSERFIHNVVYPFHITNPEANRQPKDALRRLLQFINNVFYLRYLRRLEFWKSMEPVEPEGLTVPEPEPAQVKQLKRDTESVAVGTNGNGKQKDDEEPPF